MHIEMSISLQTSVKKIMKWNIFSGHLLVSDEDPAFHF